MLVRECQRANITYPQSPVRVIDSRPIILDGEMRYRIRLRSATLPPVLFKQQVRRG